MNLCLRYWRKGACVPERRRGSKEWRDRLPGEPAAPSRFPRCGLHKLAVCDVFGGEHDKGKHWRAIRRRHSIALMKFVHKPFRVVLAIGAFVLAGCASHLPGTRVVFPKASVNGHPAKMDLDTGSSSTVLFAARAKRLGLKAADMSEPTAVTFDGQSFTAPIPITASRGSTAFFSS